MKLKEILKFAFLLLIGIFCVNLILAYSSSYNTQYSQPGYSFSSGSFTQECEPGEDFILQITPGGCSPAVVPSALLEEQDISVFCQVSATKINPLIDVESIKDISFSGEYSTKEVAGVAYFPSQVALGGGEINLNSNFMQNVGYVKITLRQQKNVSAIQNCEGNKILGINSGDVCWVTGNITANIKYDISNAFGVGKVSFYLPVMDDKDWEKVKGKYSFWNNKGYLKVENLDSDSAEISIYDEDKKISSLNLEKGKTSEMVYIPGFDCMAGLNLKLDSLENPGVRARLNVNGEIFEVQKKDTFLDGKCEVLNVDKTGIVEKVEIRCQDDEEGKETEPLMFVPKIGLEINGEYKEFLVGDFLYKYEDGADEYFAYLGYAGEFFNEDKEELEVEIVSFPSYRGEELSTEDIETTSFISENSEYRESRGKENIGGIVTKAIKGSVGIGSNFYQWMVNGLSFSSINEGEEITMGSSRVKLVGFANPVDSVLNESISLYFDKADNDYDLILSSFSETKYGSEYTKGQQAFLEKIKLANDLGLKRTALELCDDLKEKYSDFEFDTEFSIVCSNSSISNSKVSSKEFLINKEIKSISLERIYEPSFEEYGAIVYIRKAGEKESVPVRLEFNEVFYLDVLDKEGEDSKGNFIQLVGLDQNSAKILTGFDKSSFENVEDWAISSERTLKLNVAESFGSEYSFTLSKVNLKKVAKVTVLPNINNAGGKAKFGFQIGIEKRLFELTPEKAKAHLEGVEKSLVKWEKISDNLNTVVKGLNTACLGTGTFLTLKNLLSNAFFSSGQGYSREVVMNKKGGWYDICEKDIPEKYGSEEECLLANANAIEEDVKKYNDLLNNQKNLVADLEKNSVVRSSIFGDVVNDTEVKRKYLTSEYRENLKTNLKEIFGDTIKIQIGEEVGVNDFVDSLNVERVSLEELKNLELNSQLRERLGELGKIDLTNTIGDIWINNKNYNQIKKSEEEVKENNKVSGVTIIFGKTKDTKTEVYGGGVVLESFGDLVIGDLIQRYIYDGEDYYLKLEKIPGSEKYRVFSVHNLDGIEKTSGVDFKKNLIFEKEDSSKYVNLYKNPVLRYFETEPYRGMPAIVPFDLKEGWYATVKQGSGVYDESGKVESFYLCNVGEDGIQESIEEDLCQGFNLGSGQSYDEFAGLDKDKAKKKVDEAVKAIEKASEDFESKDYSVDGQKIKIGEPVANIPEIKCEDFMSVKECNLLFNVCDPVICPSSRCDFGGKYPVDNVIQSGVIGSLLLCLPNWNEGIYIPVCLTGVKAGIDGWISVQESYRDCLQKNLETGEVVGICDEIQSIYACEFFWKQTLPLVKVGAPVLIKNILGGSSHGGGEYLGFSSAFETAGKSIDYFTQYYSADSYNSFNIQNTEEVGTSICKSFVSGVYPSSLSLIGSLTNEVESPVQFYGNFEETSYTTVTNPPTSYYNVFYHIYAGNNQGAYYQVYLRDSQGSSYYQDTSYKRIVASGYVGVGETATDKSDFVANSGYKELCIRVNDQEECGFQQVSTDFGVNYVKDQYVEQQVERTDINSEEECVSGTLSGYTLVNPNVQQGVEATVNSDISDYGIIRICATENPGKGSDSFWDVENKSKWKQVGYCGNENLKCWLDTESVEDAVIWDSTAEDALEEVNSYYTDVLSKDSMTEKEFDVQVGKINEEGDFKEKIKLINELLNSESIFYDFQKAHLYLLRGNAYGELAREGYSDVSNEPEDFIGPSLPTFEEVEEKIIFEFENGQLFVSNLYYSYFDGRWWWSSDKEEWIEIPNLITGEGNKPSELNQNFILNFGEVKYNYFNGLQLLIVSTLAIEEEGLLETEKVEMDSSGIFKVKSFDENLWEVYFKYIERDEEPEELPGQTFSEPKEKVGEWEWSINEEEWYAVKDVSSYLSATDFQLQLIDEILIKDFLNFLQTKDFISGAQEIFERGSTGSYLKGSEAKILKEYGKELLGEIKGKNSCEDCGNGWLDICTEAECKSLGISLGKNCIPTDIFGIFSPGGGCVEREESYEKLSCSSFSKDAPLNVEYSNCISEESINTLLENSPATGTGEYFVFYGKKYGIDPIIALAFFRQESTFGTKGIARQTKSIGNIKYSSNCPSGKEYNGFCKYDSWEQAIEHWYKLISGSTYVGAGLNTVELITPKYAPSNENDVETYIKNVRDFVEKNSA